MFNKIKNYITKHNLITPHDTIIIGLSGGPDSVFLLHALLHIKDEYNLTLIVAHLNHEWRPEADAEEELCRHIAAQHLLTFVSQKLSSLDYHVKKNGSKEEYARHMRRHFLQSVAHHYKAQRIALGHHAQDQQETFFIRLIRGSSLTGLTSIKPHAGLYIRPLLEIHKNDILVWLNNNNITYAHDASNNSELYLRNRIRTHVLPALQMCDERFNDNFLLTLQRIQQADAFIIRMVQQTFNDISAHTGTQLELDIPAFFATDVALHHRIITHWLITEKVTFSVTSHFLQEIIRFLQSPRGGKHIVNNQWAIVKKKNKANLASIMT